MAGCEGHLFWFLLHHRTRILGKLRRTGYQIKAKMSDELIIEEEYSQMLQVCSLLDVSWSMFMVIIT